MPAEERGGAGGAGGWIEDTQRRGGGGRDIAKRTERGRGEGKGAEYKSVAAVQSCTVYC